MWIFRKRVFADDQVKMQSLGWALIQYDYSLITRGNLDTQDPSMEGGWCEDPSTSQGMPEAPRSEGRGWDTFSLTAHERNQPWQHLDFGLLASRTGPQYISFILSHPAWDICYDCPLCCLVTKLCPILWDSMDCSTAGLPVLHYPPEVTQTHVHWVSDAIQPSHPLSSPSPPAFNFSQHQGLFQWVGSSHLVAKVLELQLQLESFQWIFMTALANY